MFGCDAYAVVLNRQNGLSVTAFDRDVHISALSSVFYRVVAEVVHSEQEFEKTDLPYRGYSRNDEIDRYYEYARDGYESENKEYSVNEIFRQIFSRFITRG